MNRHEKRARATYLKGKKTMLLNVDTVLLDLKGKPIKTPVEGSNPVEFEDFTLGAAIIGAMLNQTEADRGADGKTKLAQYRIAQAVSAGGEVEFATEELAEIKKRIGTGYSPLIVGIIFDIIDPPKKKEVE